MRVMVLVAGLVGALYASGAIFLDGPGRSPADPQTFGDPWTVEGLTAALEVRGIAVELEPAVVQEEYYLIPPERAPGLPSLGGPVVHAAGLINGFQGSVLLYKNEAARLPNWHDAEDGIAWTEQAARLPESHAYGLANAVVFVNTLTATGGDFLAVQRVIRELRGN